MCPMQCGRKKIGNAICKGLRLILKEEEVHDIQKSFWGLTAPSYEMMGSRQSSAMKRASSQLEVHSCSWSTCWQSLK